MNLLNLVRLKLIEIKLLTKHQYLVFEGIMNVKILKVRRMSNLNTEHRDISFPYLSTKQQEQKS